MVTNKDRWLVLINSNLGSGEQHQDKYILRYNNTQTIICWWLHICIICAMYILNTRCRWKLFHQRWNLTCANLTSDDFSSDENRVKIYGKAYVRWRRFSRFSIRRPQSRFFFLPWIIFSNSLSRLNSTDLFGD